MDRYLEAAREAIAHCRAIAQFSEEPGFITRTFLSPPMRDVHNHLCAWMRSSGMSTRIDAVGNWRGIYPASVPNAPRLLIASHLDTVPRAGPFDGILGVVLGVSLVNLVAGARLPYEIEVIGFSEEEGVRFGVPFLGSRALIGDVHELMARKDKDGISVEDAIRSYGLDPTGDPIVADNARAYLEFHIEQGPVLESLNLPLGIVETIAGQSRLDVTFEGHSNHAGTTPMHLRRDALAAAAEWIQAVEQEALATAGLFATVGRVETEPNVSNAIAGKVQASLDVRHAQGCIRRAAVQRLLTAAQVICSRRNLGLSSKTNLEQEAVPMNGALSRTLEQAVSSAGVSPHRMTSGAGHDAMIVARRIPAAMLFLRSPGGLSHHPDESVILEDVAAALHTGMQFLKSWEAAVD